jgi:hypothetical protein
MRLSLSLAVALLLSASLARAQLAPLDPDWHEVEAPPAPAFSLEGLVPLETPRSTLRYGVAPATVSIGPDGVVRYVVVAASSAGAMNVMYEGIRCNTGEFKVYARHSPGGGWTIVKGSEWKPLQDAPLPRHALLIARTGACIGHGINQPAARIVRDLRASVDARFNPSQ